MLIHCPKVQDRYKRVLFNYEYNNLFNIIVLDSNKWHLTRLLFVLFDHCALQFCLLKNLSLNE